ncbi:MAG: hypothetical protein JRI23_29290, partial [Deltaproteobacteria bacterium]|nr:hypothetical protein [Deltaproteobacteria bacterium]MBW2536234.1 hypothetical protein [Deltaproteobacteria bacterium]
LLGRQLVSQSGHYPLDEGEIASRMREAADERLREAAYELLDASPGHGAARAVLLELAHGRGDVDGVAELLLQSGSDDAGASREQLQAKALFAELTEDPERVREVLERARLAVPDDTATLRMALEHAELAEAARELSAFADATTERTAAAVCLTEAALRLVAEHDPLEADPLLQRAAQVYPELPIASFVGLQLAIRAADAEALASWLTRRREATPELADQVPDLLREALLLDHEEALRTQLLEEAHRARPSDLALRVLYEQAAGEAAADRSEWLAQQLEQTSGDQGTAALEAALSFELDGDLERAAECAQMAASGDADPLAPLFRLRYALQGHGAEQLVTELAAEYERLSEPQERRELAALIARIELEGRREPARANGWLRSALGEDPTHLPTLRALERTLAATEDPALQETVAMSIARVLSGPEAASHAMLAARLMENAGRFAETEEAVSIACQAEPQTLWALRQTVAHGASKNDHATLATVYPELAQRTEDPMEQATLLLRAAEANLATGDDDQAFEQLGEAMDLWPDHYMVRLQRAKLLERVGSVADAAGAFEQLAMVSRDAEQRASSLYRAASMWLSLDDSIGTEEGRRLLEAVSAIDPNYEDTFDRLKAIYLAVGAKNELADLLDARLQTVTDPDERIRMEVLRGKVLAEAGAAAEARAALEAAVQASPDNAEALSAYADVCTVEQDWPAVEDALIQLGRLVADAEAQTDVYLRLGELYGEHLPNPERAELAYQEVLKRTPDHQGAREKLVDLYLEAGDITKAFEQQKSLIDGASDPSEQCSRVVRLAEIYEAAGDAKQAEATLVKARRTFGKEPGAMVALYHFYRRNGQEPQADKLLDRAAAEVRRGLGAGRFEAGLFQMVVTVAQMRGQEDTAQIAGATLAAIEGEVTAFEGCGDGAASPDLDDLIAPDIFGPPFRKLLQTTGSLLELAAPLDLGAMRAKPLGTANADVSEMANRLAAAYGVGPVQMYSSNALGPVCLSACTEPATLLFGQQLLEADSPAAQEFLVHRALKLVQTRTAALARTAPIDLWPLVAAYLKIHSPSFAPQGVDQRRFDGFHAQMAEQGVRTDPQTSMTASEVIKGIGNRASSLNTMAASWGSRAALLALGDPYTAITAVAWALGNAQGPPASGQDRVKWISRKAEARDLIVFSVSDNYAEARAQLTGS